MILRRRNIACGARNPAALVTTVRGKFEYSPYASIKHRPAQTPAQRKADQHITFPKTLKSGRYENLNAHAQKLYKPEVGSEKAPDARFYQPIKDYTDVQDSDPHAALFGESAAVKKMRVREWQKQFEQENSETWLPYERDTALKKAAPNWFVKFFVEMRDGGGTNSYIWAFGPFVAGSTLLVLWLRSHYIAPDAAKELSEIR